MLRLAQLKQQQKTTLFSKRAALGLDFKMKSMQMICGKYAQSTPKQDYLVQVVSFMRERREIG